MRIQTIYIGHLSENCYILETESSAIVVDPGRFNNALRSAADRIKNKNTLILLTHCHFDHISGTEKLAEFLDCKVAIGEHEAENLIDDSVNLCTRFHLPENKRQADILLKDNEEFSVGDLKFKVLHTPGHTSGSVCYLLNDVLISGDTLFNQNIGRTDLKTGSEQEMIKSLERLSNLDGDVKVYSGHGLPTTIAEEKANNIYMKRATLV